MDSLTQAVLGAAVYGAGMGRFQKRKALLIGAVLGTLPDLDVFIRYDDPISAMTFHRGWSHSLFYLTALSLFITWLVFKRNPHRAYSFLRLFLSLALALVTHPIIDAMTMYGTQLFYPLPITPISWATVFIIDPIYTLPLIFACLWALWRGLTDKTVKGLYIAVIFGFVYFGWGFVGKIHHEQRFAAHLQTQGVELTRIASSPTPFNTILWRIFGEDEQGNFYEGYSGWLDSNPPEFSKMSLNRPLREPIWNNASLLQRLDWFTDGWLLYEQTDNKLIANDVRLGFSGNWGIFRFVVAEKQDEEWQIITPQQLDQEGYTMGNITPNQIWQRVLGNGSLIPR